MTMDKTLFQFNGIDNFLFSQHVAQEKLLSENFNLIYMNVTKPSRVLLSLKCLDYFLTSRLDILYAICNLNHATLLDCCKVI